MVRKVLRMQGKKGRWSRDAVCWGGRKGTGIACCPKKTREGEAEAVVAGVKNGQRTSRSRLSVGEKGGRGKTA